MRFTVAILLASIPLSQSAWAEDTYTVGLEGFRDVYKEPSATVDDRSNYGSVTAGYTWTVNDYFSAIDGRYSQGTDHYKSDSGTGSGAPQYETDTRWRLGYNFSIANDHLSPYFGIGWRWFLDDGKGRYDYSDGMISAFQYDRRINQFYVPIGLTDRYVTNGGWSFSWNAEVDPVFDGIVKSRLAEGGNPNLPNISNHQTSGLGARGDLMLGHTWGPYLIEAGPFIRYWNINQSEITDVDPTTHEGYIEPKNTRAQYGLALKITY